MKTLWILLASLPILAAADDPNFGGTWKTAWGDVELSQLTNQVNGTYTYNGVTGVIDGEVEDGTLRFKYTEGEVRGVGEFTLRADANAFTGRWRLDPTHPWRDWHGTRSGKPQGFAGLWETNFGRMRLVQKGTKVEGGYLFGGAHAEIRGELVDGTLQLRYQEPSTSGEAVFTMGAEGQSFTGKWRPKGVTDWSQWNGKRVVPEKGRMWLVVIEAPWETQLTQREYAFGEMLDAFFDRVPTVEVRHRFFANPEGFTTWAREVAYIAEPVVVSLSAHGSSKGLQVGGKTVGIDVVGQAFRYASNLQLLHFSSCEVMKGNAATQVRTELGPGVKFPISGYATSVDWAESAVIEFAYFDMILARKKPPVVAAKQLLKLMPFAGDKSVPGVDAKPARFRFSPSDAAGK